MKRKFLWMGLSLLIIAALVLSACAKQTTVSTSAAASTTPTTPTTTKTSTTAITSATVKTTTAATTATGEPKYGGNMTVLTDQAFADPPSWDIDTSQRGSSTSVWVNPYLEWYGFGDIETYGPRGTNQYSFQLTTYVPDQYLGGQLAQSWEFNTNPISVTFHLRQGIMWTGNQHIGMAARELTATDAAFTGMRLITAPASAPSFTWVKDVIAVDKYTVRWNFNTYNSNWPFYLVYGGNSGVPFCPESANAGGADWKNAVGTGPFILTDYVSGSSATYTRNPNYWGKTTINGKQYQMPFIDSLNYPVIPDASTELAALRTGKIDLWSRVPLNNGDTLKKTSPDLIQTKWISAQVLIFYINRIDSQPLSNLSVRQALMMATDFNTILKLVWGDGNILGWPVSSGNPSYTPLEKEPAAIQALFTYNLTKAKQMLSDAGYPNGFPTTLSYNSSDPIQANVASIIASEWAKAGVVVTLQPTDQVALTAIKTARSYKGFLEWSVATANPLTPILYVQGNTLGSTYKAGEPLDIESVATTIQMDPAKRQTQMTQLAQDMLADAGYIPLADPAILNCYWPWLKNYFGEVDSGYHNQVPMISRTWVDQVLKKKMGY